MNKPVVSRVARSVCPHDCPSTCALDVEIVDAHTIGRVRGAKDDPYTAGVICEKVARYAERIHHPDRLTHPMRRVGTQGRGALGADLVGRGVRRDHRALDWRSSAEFGPEAIWPYFYAGTMGHVQRDGIDRLRHAKGYSEQYDTICTGAAWPGFIAGTGAAGGPNPEQMAEADCVVIWGTNAVNTQVNVMTHAMRARKERGAKIVVIDIYQNATMDQADMPILLRPGFGRRVRLRGDARAAARRPGRPRLSRAVHRLRRRGRSASDDAHARMGGRDHRAERRRDRGLRPSRRHARPRPISASATASRGSATAPPTCTPRSASRPSPAPGGIAAGGAFHSNSGTWHLDKSLITGTRHGQGRARARHVARSARC